VEPYGIHAREEAIGLHGALMWQGRGGKKEKRKKIV
jgi:hypothetical protein